jgi:Na+/H+ antiporter NhaC
MKILSCLRYVLLILFILFCSTALAQSHDINVAAEGIILSKIPFNLRITVTDEHIGQTAIIRGLAEVESVNFTSPTVRLENMVLKQAGRQAISIEFGDRQMTQTLRVVPAWLALIPPLMAILLALLTREMLLSLFAGVWAGVTILTAYNPFNGFFKALDTYVVGAMANPGHAAIIIFSLLFGGVIGIFSKNGGMMGIVQAASRYARTRRSGQIATSIMGVIIFFDDYANTLLVGNTMRPFTDRLKISREKLAYIVDSTAAPVANLAFISTWSVFQMSLLDVPFANAGVTASPYITFLKSIPYGFYSIFAIWLLFWLGILRRDYGPMYRAETRAANEGKLLRDGAAPLMDDSMLQRDGFGEKASHWLNAIIPILVVIGMTIVGLYITGRRNLGDAPASLQNIIGNSDSYASLVWGAALGGFTALVLSVAQHLLTLRDTVEAWLSGVKSMALAAIVLLLAWTLGKVCEDLKTAEFITFHAQRILVPSVLPIITFLVAASISFSTGTSWGTMTILVPLIIPLALKMTSNAVDSQIFLASFGAILSGATFGDHCSPISDTTILSSMASGSDHIDHVKTQIPYALTAAFFAALFGYLPVGLGVPGFYMMIPTFILIVLFVRFVGRRIYDRSEPGSATQ